MVVFLMLYHAPSHCTHSLNALHKHACACLTDITLASNGQFTLPVVVGDYYTVSTVRTARRGSFPAGSPVPASQPVAPIPVIDDFDGYGTDMVSQQPRLWSQMIGSWELQLDR